MNLNILMYIYKLVPPMCRYIICIDSLDFLLISSIIHLLVRSVITYVLLPSFITVRLVIVNLRLHPIIAMFFPYFKYFRCQPEMSSAFVSDPRLLRERQASHSDAGSTVSGSTQRHSNRSKYNMFITKS